MTIEDHVDSLLDRGVEYEVAQLLAVFQARIANLERRVRELEDTVNGAD